MSSNSRTEVKDILKRYEEFEKTLRKLKQEKFDVDSVDFSADVEDAEALRATLLRGAVPPERWFQSIPGEFRDAQRKHYEQLACKIKTVDFNLPVKFWSEDLKPVVLSLFMSQMRDEKLQEYEHRMKVRTLIDLLFQKEADARFKEFYSRVVSVIVHF